LKFVIKNLREEMEMLLAKAPPTPLTINLTPKAKSRLLELNWKSSQHCNERGVRLVVRARDSRYTRTPMETPGAYQLIDNDTGEKFIVWGGGDDDSSIPSKDILSWKPSTTVIPNNSITTNEGALCLYIYFHFLLYLNRPQLI
jgi:hypothetical protein